MALLTQNIIIMNCKIQLLTFSFIICGFMASCNCQSKQNIDSSSTETKDSLTLLDEEVGVPDSITFDFDYYRGSKLRFFLSNFFLNNPDIFNNEIAMDSYSEKLKKELDKIIQNDSTFIMDLVVNYDEIVTQNATDNKTGEKVFIIGCKGGCENEEGYFSNDKFLYRVKYSVVGGVPKEEMLKLKDDGTNYTISGTISTRVDEDYDGNKFGFSNKYGKGLHLGCFFIKDLKLSEVQY